MAAAQAIPVPRKAEKRRVKLKIAIQGTSGSGKTDGALSLAKNLVPNGKVLVVDTENESASLYADRFEFDTIPLSAPYTSARYEACIDAAVRGGYDVLVLDGITPQWDGEGGILRRKEELDKRPGSNSFTNWAAFTPEHTHFIETIKQAPIHIIATMRSKTEYILQANDRGKQMPKKVGTSPIQRDGFEYEFSLVLDVQMDHRAIAIKDRTTLFSDEPVNLRDAKVAEMLTEWLASAKIEPEKAAAPTAVASPAPLNPVTNIDESYQILELCKVDEITKSNSKKDMFSMLINPVEGLDMAFCYDIKLHDRMKQLVGTPIKVTGKWGNKGFFVNTLIDEPF